MKSRQLSPPPPPPPPGVQCAKMPSFGLLPLLSAGPWAALHLLVWLLNSGWCAGSPMVMGRQAYERMAEERRAEQGAWPAGSQGSKGTAFALNHHVHHVSKVRPALKLLCMHSVAQSWCALRIQFALGPEETLLEVSGWRHCSSRCFRGGIQSPIIDPHVDSATRHAHATDVWNFVGICLSVNLLLFISSVILLCKMRTCLARPKV